MNISKHIKRLRYVKRKGISEMVFIAFAAVAVFITILIAFR